MKNVFYILLSELVLVPFLVTSQELPRPAESARDQPGDLQAFSHMSAVAIGDRYFERPPYRLFAIRRLIELGDPVVVPVLQRAFADETEVTRRRFIAATLVSLGDLNYFDYLADAAREAIKSDLPFPFPLSGRGESKSNPPFRPHFLQLVQDR